jgi:NADH-quinone oxidoreductase subunit J
VLVGGTWAFAPDATQHVVASPTPLGVTNTEALGNLIYTDYFYLFQTAGAILLVAIIGAITLTLRTRPAVRRQNLSRQVHRRPAEAVELRKVRTGSGI